MKIDIKNFIEQLFVDSGYKKNSDYNSDFTIFQHNSFSDYWIITPFFSVDKQKVFFDQLEKPRSLKSDFEKNLTILMLNNLDADGALSESQCIEIENDPFYFKKNILSYTEEAFEKMMDSLGEISLANFSKKLFDEKYYESLLSDYGSNQSGFSLSYAIAQKLPFLVMNIEQKNYECESFYEKIDDDTKSIIDGVNNEKNIKEYIRKFVFGEI